MQNLLRNLVTAAILLLGFLALTASAFEVEIYDHKHYRGRHTTVDVRGCTNIPTDWDDIVTSVEPAQCILIFKHPDCQGPRVRLEPYAFGTACLEEVNFDEKLSSMAPCNFNPPSSRGRSGRDEH